MNTGAIIFSGVKKLGGIQLLDQSAKSLKSLLKV